MTDIAALCERLTELVVWDDAADNEPLGTKAARKLTELQAEVERLTRVCDSYADENQRLFDRAEALQADAERERINAVAIHDATMLNRALKEENEKLRAEVAGLKSGLKATERELESSIADANRQNHEHGVQFMRAEAALARIKALEEGLSLFAYAPHELAIKPQWLDEARRLLEASASPEKPVPTDGGGDA